MYPELDELDFDGLRAAFEGPPVDGDEFAASYFDEVAIRIRRVGDEQGVHYLLSQAERVDPARLQAIFVALTMPPPINRPDVHVLLMSHLDDEHELVVASVIDGLAVLGGVADTRPEVSRRHDDARSLVRGAVLRYLAQVDGQRAIPTLIEALDDPDPRVRENAIDELDELEAEVAVSNVQRLTSDPNPKCSAGGGDLPSPSARTV